MKNLQIASFIISESGPAIRAEFFLQDKRIEKINLGISQTGAFEWRTNDPYLEKSTLFPLIKEWIESYCKGQQPEIVLPLMLEGLPSYTTQVLSILRDIPFGFSLSYKTLAEISGNPRGARAVGNACGKNPFPLIIPCHRVLASKNRLGGFSNDCEIKKNLLRFEKVAFHS